MATPLIALTGGIGAGKSVVSRILATLGYPVYDSDSRAKALMDSSPQIRQALKTQIHPLSVDDATGVIDRKLLSKIVFANAEMLQRLNAIVHGAVRADIRHWATQQTAHLAFVETAILRESGLDQMVDGEWHVTAPEAVRIARVMARSGLTPQQARQRIDSQQATPTLSQAVIIDNDPNTAILPQTLAAIDKTKHNFNCF